MKLQTGESCRIGQNLRLLGEGTIILGEEVKIGDDVFININGRLSIGDRSAIGEGFKIEGRDITIGKEFWSGRFCGIGGGSRFERTSSLKIGDMCHLGDFGFINTARPVDIGDEVGLGQYSRLYTHGAYESFLKGFPVEFGPVTLEDRVWCPSAIIMPNVTIGHDTVVGAGAVVTHSLPSGCIAVGVPAKVIKESCFPKKFRKQEKTKMIKDFIIHFLKDIQSSKEIRQSGSKITVSGAVFDLDEMTVDGKANELSEKFKDELRRYGVRFRFYSRNGIYARW